MVSEDGESSQKAEIVQQLEPGAKRPGRSDGDHGTNYDTARARL